MKKIALLLAIVLIMVSLFSCKQPDSQESNVSYNETSSDVSQQSDNSTASEVSEESVLTEVSDISETSEVSEVSEVSQILDPQITLPVNTLTLEIGKTYTVVPETKDISDSQITYESSSTVVAIVDNNGLITAKAVGSTIITVSAGNIKAEITVTVKQNVVAVTSVTLNKGNSTIYIGDTLTLIATVLPSNATDKNIGFSSNNKAVSTVSVSGVVTAVAKGSAVITATASNGKKASITITVEEKPRAYPTINGSFIQYGPFLNYTDAQLEKHFDYLEEAGIEYLVLFTSASQNKDGSFGTVYYPSELAKKNKGSNYNDTYKNMTERMLKECQKHSIKAYISPNYSDEGWSSNGISDSSWYKSFSQSSVSIATEIYNLYKDKYSDTFYGWYFVPEFSNYFINSFPYDRASDILNIYIDGLNALDSSMPFLMSPYFADFSPYSNAVDTAKAWDKIFAKVHFRKGDIFCPQDCVGSGLASPQIFINYYSEFKKVIDKYDNLAFWGNPESFKQANWTSAPITRFVYQLEKAEPYVEGFISFAYSHYYAPDVTKIDIFHNAYKKYYETGVIDYYSTNTKATPLSLTAEQTATGVTLTAQFSNCKYGISYIEIYRGSTLIGTVHTPEENYADAKLTFVFSDKGLTATGSYKYTIKAVDFIKQNTGETSKTVSVTVANCVSIGKSYTTDYNGNQGYPDDGKKLTDGKYATTDTYSDSAASGFADVSDVSFIIDLKSSYKIETVVARTLSSGSGGAIISSNVEVSFSTDGVTFSNAINVDATTYPLENGYSVVEIPVTNVNARYVKISYIGLRNWLFIDEFSVYSE
ncbi:MAG: hypothetical protein A2Y17_07225 [Clostridiales bacterium GWF2_38_85]|nr:MAG: hypothetical protein A2Y17_07225 [Clostridiales bacterium GWF2_38_85]HBL85004.1 hypothetical protein [Clostridiales bacterium]